MESVKVWRNFGNTGYRWGVWVDGELHGFGVETQRQTWRQMDKDCDRFLERALEGETEPTPHDPYKVPNSPPENAAEKLEKDGD